jgi:hypothetical protein
MGIRSFPTNATGSGLMGSKSLWRPEDFLINGTLPPNPIFDNGFHFVAPINKSPFIPLLRQAQDGEQVEPFV